MRTERGITFTNRESVKLVFMFQDTVFFFFPSALCLPPSLPAPSSLSSPVPRPFRCISTAACLSTAAPWVVADPTEFFMYITLGVYIAGTGAVPRRGSGQPMLSESYRWERAVSVQRKCILSKGATRCPRSLLFLTKQGFDGVKGKCVAYMLLKMKPCVLRFFFPSPTLTAIPPEIWSCQ